MTPKVCVASRVRISTVLEINLSADELVSSLLSLDKNEPVYILDSCGVGHLGSHLLIAGFRPIEIFEIGNKDADETLRILDEKLAQGYAAIFTLSYDFGIKLQPISVRGRRKDSAEPDLYLALFDSLIV